ncbi:IMD-like protein [Apostichopus japonicus]|uniref:IMD-like protein n=1 Tax=Stichopus japonicus TaxID=307972 RepID=A0A2G8LKL5_STIJA|nr:IMD-like protein [Apostichopus japonicus]
MVYSSHHAKGCKPMWRPKPNVLYQLNDTNCVIWVESFSWETCEIDGKIVEFKKIQVYAAGNLNPLSKIIPIHVGFYPKLPGERPNNLQILEEIPFLFRKEGNLPLKIIFKEVKPMSWKYTGEEKVKTIPFINVAAVVDCRCSFVFERVGEEGCTLVFKAIQEDPVDLIVQFQNPSLSSHQAIRGEAKGNPVGAEAMTIDSKVVEDETLLDLSGNLSKEWRDVGRKLKLKETDLRNIEADNKSNGQKEVVYQMLLLWKQKHGIKATNKTLRDALKQLIERTCPIIFLIGNNVERLQMIVEDMSDIHPEYSGRRKELILQMLTTRMKNMAIGQLLEFSTKIKESVRTGVGNVRYSWYALLPSSSV